MQTSTQQFRELQEEYFDHLDTQGIEYLTYDEADQGHVFSSVKTEFIKTAFEMVNELGFETIAEYLDHKKAELEADETAVTVEKVFGRFLVSYDGKDLYVHDRQDDQHVVVGVDFNQDTIELMCTAMIETMKKYNKAKGDL